MTVGRPSRTDRREDKISAFRFIHTADIHLDSPLRSLALANEDLATVIGNATRGAFVRVVDLCLEERVDALLLSGDLYDGDQTSMKTARFLAEQVRRLDEAGIRVFVIRGNHDALSRITRELVFPETVKVFGGRAEAVPVERGRGDLPIVVHGLSFTHPQAPESLLGKYKAPVDGAVNIGLMHTSLDGSPGHDLYAPCSLADLERSGFRYWALGHIHRRAVSEGIATVVMPGMPQGRDINEAGPKSVALVTIGDDRSVRVEERATSVAEFARVPVDVAGIEDWRDLVGAVGAALDRERETIASEHAVLRLCLGGATPLAWRLRRDLDLLKTEAEDRAALIGRCWVEKVEVDCRAPGDPGAARADPFSELRSLVETDVLASAAYRQEVVDFVEELMRQLPAEVRERFGADADGFAATVASIGREGAEDVLAYLHAGRRDAQG